MVPEASKEQASRGPLLGALALAVLIAASCAPIYVDVEYDTGADFSRYRTWGWLPEPEATGHARADNPAIRQMIREAIEAQLASRGFALADDPSMRVGYHMSIEKKVHVRTVSSGQGYPQYDGRDVEVRAETKTYVDEYERGTLVIDVVDAKRRTLMWRGVGEGRLRREPTPEQTGSKVRGAVADILGHFPPGGGE